MATNITGERSQEGSFGGITASTRKHSSQQHGTRIRAASLKEMQVSRKSAYATEDTMRTIQAVELYAGSRARSSSTSKSQGEE